MTDTIEQQARKIAHHLMCGGGGEMEATTAIVELVERAQKDVTRFEVIDYRIGGEGRAFVAWPASVELSYQDDGRTLKVFVTNPALTKDTSI